MLISRRLKVACPKCSATGAYGNIFVRAGFVLRGCNHCKHTHKVALPPLRKRILYLDQFFLSHAFRKREARFVAASERIQELAHRQLLVCPWSPTHELETHLWRHDQQADLWKFIKQTARGHSIRPPEAIKHAQTLRAYRAHSIGADPQTELQSADAFSRDLHTWDDYVWIGVGRFVDDAEEIRKSKANMAAGLVSLFDEWARSDQTFQQDLIDEARGYGRAFLELYLKNLAALRPGGTLDYFSAPPELAIVETLALNLGEEMPWNSKLKALAAFFASPHFLHTPYVYGSCAILATLRKHVRLGQFKNREKAVAALGGLSFDVEVVSVYAPYCDAVFLDRTMRRWVVDKDGNLPERYGFRAFSADTWDELDAFLDAVAASETDTHRSALEVINPPA